MGLFLAREVARFVGSMMPLAPLLLKSSKRAPPLQVHPLHGASLSQSLNLGLN